MRYFCYFKAYAVFNFIPSFSFKVNETATLQLRKLKYNRLCFLYKDIVLIGTPIRGMHMTENYDLTAREVYWCPKRSFLTLNFMFSSCFLRNCLIWRFLRGSDSKESACNAGDLFDPWVRKIPLEKKMAIHSNILAWRFPWTEEPGRHLWGCKESGTTEQLTLSFSPTLSVLF